MIEQGLNTTTPEYWPINAKHILKSKHISVGKLRKEFIQISLPWDPTYNTDRVYFSLRIQQRPLFIIKPACKTELEKILNLVHVKKLTIRIMNGRHSSALVHSEVLIDMTNFTHKKLKRNVLIAGAGNTQGMLNDFLFNQNGLEHYSHFGSMIHPRVDTDAFPGGSAASVGSAGIATAGGIGTLCRTYSLTVDSIKSFEIVLCPTSDKKSRTICVSKKSHPNLFWALRGGVGCNFGIVTEIQYKIIEVPSIILYKIKWPWTEAVRVLRQWKKTSINRPAEFNEDLVLFHNPETKQQGIELDGIFVCENNISEHFAIEKIRLQVADLGGTLTIDRPIPYSTLYKNLVKDRVYYNFSIIQPVFLSEFSPTKVVHLMNRATKLSGPISMGFTLLGGKISTKTPKQTAFYPREKKFFVDTSARWQNISEGQEIEAWTDSVVQTLLKADPDSTNFAYVGFPITFSNIKHTGRVYYGKNYRRLQRIKKRYDPLNIMTACGTIKF